MGLFSLLFLIPVGVVYGLFGCLVLAVFKKPITLISLCVFVGIGAVSGIFSLMLSGLVLADDNNYLTAGSFVIGMLTAVLASVFSIQSTGRNLTRLFVGLTAFVTLALSAVVIVIWEGPASEADVIGIYDMVTDGGMETLELTNDHKFLHTYQRNEGNLSRHQGSWKLSSGVDASRIVLYSPPAANRRINGEWAPEVFKNLFGRVTIPVNLEPKYERFLKR
ncbi:MAG: hypothetical protein O3A84_14970 [Proteobacteria bacterium]|nr:hypothetical protein [Pseudomonadota bacterium]